MTTEVFTLVAIAAPLTIAITQGLKAGGITSSRWAMPTACAVGVLICFLVAGTDIVEGFDARDDWALAVLAGIVTGLSAAGLYSGGQKVVGAA